jgi:hypothetical protein
LLCERRNTRAFEPEDNNMLWIIGGIGMVVALLIGLRFMADHKEEP